MKDFFKNLINKYHLCLNSEQKAEVRLFAGFEIFCTVISFITFLWLLIAIICSCMGCPQGKTARSFMMIFLSAAVGYLTNYIAIEMLFKPYEEKKWHPFRIITFGYWKQGLVPKNKHDIGCQTGKIVVERLLPPDKLADDMCSWAKEYLKRVDTISQFKNYIKEILEKNKERLTESLAPRIEEELIKIVRRLITPESIRSFVTESVMPFITKDSTRDMFAKYITDGLQQRVPDLTEMIKKELRTMTVRYLQDKKNLPLLAQTVISPIAPIIADGLVTFINWNSVQDMIKEKAGGTEFYEMVKDEIFKLGDKLTDWLNSTESETQVYGFIAEIHTKISSWMRQNLAPMLGSLADNLIGSEALWDWTEKELLPIAREKLEEFIRNKGKDTILEKLDLDNRISGAIDNMDVREFHETINEVAAQHLGAIQVLGWFLGGIIGLLQLLL